MKTFQTLSLLVAISLMLPSCMTTYDSNGRPVQSVDPGVATVGVIGALLVGAALANDNDDNHNRHHNRRHYNNRRHHYQPTPCAAPRQTHYRRY